MWWKFSFTKDKAEGLAYLCAVKWENIRIERAGSRGVCVAHTPEGKTLLVTGAAPGDVGTVVGYRKKKGHVEGRLESISVPSPDRVEPVCSHFGSCGGCKWQHVAYPAQVAFKGREVQDHLERIGKVTTAHFEEPVAAPSPYGYRNKTEYSFSALRWLSPAEMASGEVFTDRSGLGFHAPGLWDKVLDVNVCHLVPDTGNRIRLWIRETARSLGIPFYHIREQHGCLRTLTLRSNRANEWMVILQYAEPHPGLDELAAGLRAAFPEVVSFYWGLNTKGNDSIYDVPLELVYGSPFLLESMASVVPNRAPLRFQIGPKSFYQTNPDQAEVLYRKTLEMAQLEAGERVYDLYTGTGTIALFLAQTAEYVAGIESVPEAIEAAQENARFNGFSNAHFEVGDMRRVFNPEFIARHGAPTTVVTDPPRDGMHPKVVEQLIELKAPKLVYVSCNSATQARDLELLQSVYRVETVQPVDLFPQTHHMESIARLTLR